MLRPGLRERPRSGGAGTLAPMTRARLAVLALLSLSCRKEAKPLDPERPPVADSGGPKVAIAAVPRTFHPQTCPPASAAPPALPPPDEGCEACKKGEFCKSYSVRGRTFGRCERSTCEKDADCGGALCACGPPNTCVPGNCRDADDCGGLECAADRWRYGHGTGMYCRTSNDDCKTHADCGKGKECAYESGRWTCRPEIPAPPPG